MADAPIVEAEGYLRKIIKLAKSPVQDENKREQIQRCAEKTLGLLNGIAQAGRPKIITEDEAKTLVHGDDA